MVHFHGRFVWYELITTDIAAAKAFYTNVVGWDARDASMPDMAYNLFTVGEASVSGLTNLREEARGMGAKPCWIGYVGVDDLEMFAGRLHAKVLHVDASARFLGALGGVTDPEAKRKIIGREFVNVFQAEAARRTNAQWLAQGTIYPDVIESAAARTKKAHTIKSHHNVGGLPEDMEFELVEPLRALFKDEVRKVGTELGLPDEIVWRQPFPGPGLGVRIIGEVTPDKVAMLQAADAIVREEVKAAGLEREIWQAFAVLPDIRSVGVMGDERTYGHPIIIRAVTSEDAMTADWARLPYDLLERMSSRIINEVSGVNRVAYDVTSKPPGTIEWE